MTDPEAVFDASPPDSSAPGGQGLKAQASAALSRLLLPLLQRSARGFVGGERVEDAIAVATEFAKSGTPTTLGYWPAEILEGRAVADVLLAAIEQVAVAGLDSYLSIKPPSLRFDETLAAELSAAAKGRVRLHCDSHGLNVAAASHAFADALAAQTAAESVGVTLPGRWKSSLADADWATERGVHVRVVKGQWPDPSDPERDLRQGYLELIDRLAGRARHVAVATHDLALAQAAIGRLRAAEGSFELEMILGMPIAPLLRWARENDVRTRIYVPFGPGYIPNALGILRRNPRLFWRMAGGVFGGGGR